MRRFAQALSKHLPLAIMAAAALSLMPVDGFAQYGNAFKLAPHLTKQDIAIMRKTVREGLEGKPNGTTLPWNNPKSHRYGTVTLINRFPSQGRDCRRVRYVINPGSNAEVRTTYALTSCHLADGTWKIDNAAKPDQSQ